MGVLGRGGFVTRGVCESWLGDADFDMDLDSVARAEPELEPACDAVPGAVSREEGPTFSKFMGRIRSPGGPLPFLRFLALFIPSGEGRTPCGGGSGLEEEGLVSTISVASTEPRRAMKDASMGDWEVEAATSGFAGMASDALRLSGITGTDAPGASITVTAVDDSAGTGL